MAYVATRSNRRVPARLSGLGLYTDEALRAWQDQLNKEEQIARAKLKGFVLKKFLGLIQKSKDQYQAALAERRAADISAATFEAQMAAAEKKAEADLRAKLELTAQRQRDLQAQQEADAALQTSLLTVSPRSLFAPAVTTAPVSAGLLSSSMMPFVIGGGLLLAVLFLKK